ANPVLGHHQVKRAVDQPLFINLWLAMVQLTHKLYSQFQHTIALYQFRKAGTKIIQTCRYTKAAHTGT
ncbi:hypothetical protein, partial [Aeromonas caviae]|uniref:hypothetical protein n=1 Tax=Aeromonas caviae TaxID=648 RepID=UPI00244A4898